MNRLNNIENGEIRKSSEASESNFDNEGHKKIMDKIKEEKAEQKKIDLAKISELTEKLNKIDINEFIQNEVDNGLKEMDIVYNLIIEGYNRDEIMGSNLNEKTKESLKDKKQEIIKKYFLPNLFRFKDEKDIDEKFLTILRNVQKNGISYSEAIKKEPLKHPITLEDINNGIRSLDNTANNYTIDLSGEILPDLDWSNSKEIFRYLNFDDRTFSRTSKDHLPKGYDPETVFNNGKTIGLGIDDVHQMGYMGEGISVAICDVPLNNHNDIQYKEYSGEEGDNTESLFHASAVSSILVGKQTGIAPNADLHFFSENTLEKDRGESVKSNLKKILKRNKELPNNKKIRVVSISGPVLAFGKECIDLVKELEDSGVFVICSETFVYDFGFLDKKNPVGKPDNFDNYQISYPDEKQLKRIKEYENIPSDSIKNKNDRIMYDFYKQVKPIEELLFVNSGDRTVADPKSETAYRHYSSSCTSWSIPAVAGYYTLACQADPSMTPKRFKILARETATIIDANDTYKEFQKPHLGRIPINKKIKVINIKALIQKIEEGKNK